MFLEKEFHKSKEIEILGVDEVGRGPLAGPVVSSSVRFFGDGKKLSFFMLLLSQLKVNDSKKLTQKKRREILKTLGINLNLILQNQVYRSSIKGIEFEYSVVEIDNLEIDKINILQASLKAMGRGVLLLSPNHSAKIWVDGNKKPPMLESYLNVEAIVKGDSKSGVIALSSIIAKEYRDNLMEKYASTFPGYGFEKHAGYPTKEHKAALLKLGISPIHRKTFKGVKELL